MKTVSGVAWILALGALMLVPICSPSWTEHQTAEKNMDDVVKAQYDLSRGAT